MRTSLRAIRLQCAYSGALALGGILWQVMIPVTELAESQFDELLEKKRDELNHLKDEVDKVYTIHVRRGQCTLTNQQYLPLTERATALTGCSLH